ncbi:MULTISPECIES: hypothetical protein [unclassified Streptomyces]|uniref:hypothetical protein n=1 Tax=unclassified Streptomyces TaxID=2593676 RepID=UPI000DD92221|nr:MULTISPECIES: hypothetical protein [unclassified Streptomyces]QZZ25719.1 hypothetical protein A7X85_05095 [Streptomyces sp. ST1015]
MAAFMAFFDGSTTTWRVSSAAVTSGITELWPEVEADPTQLSEVRAFRWSFCTDEGQGEVLLPEDGTGLYLDAALADSAHVACLLRRLMPASVELVFCDQGFNFDVRVQPGVTAAELIADVDAQP